MAQERTAGRDWFAFWTAAFLRILCVVVPVALTFIAGGGVWYFGIAVTWFLVAILLGTRPTWDDDYRPDRPIGQVVLICFAWSVGVVGAVVAGIVVAFNVDTGAGAVGVAFVAYLSPAMSVAVVTFAVVRVLARRSAR